MAFLKDLNNLYQYLYQDEKRTYFSEYLITSQKLKVSNFSYNKDASLCFNINNFYDSNAFCLLALKTSNDYLVIIQAKAVTSLNKSELSDLVANKQGVFIYLPNERLDVFVDCVNLSLVKQKYYLQATNATIKPFVTSSRLSILNKAIIMLVLKYNLEQKRIILSEIIKHNNENTIQLIHSDLANNLAVIANTEWNNLNDSMVKYFKEYRKADDVTRQAFKTKTSVTFDTILKIATDYTNLANTFLSKELGEFNNFWSDEDANKKVGIVICYLKWNNLYAVLGPKNIQTYNELLAWYVKEKLHLSAARIVQTMEKYNIYQVFDWNPSEAKYWLYANSNTEFAIAFSQYLLDKKITL